MSRNDVERVRQLYPMIFDEKGKIKLCGRDVCKDMICTLGRIFEGVDFGNVDTGFMHVDVVKAYYDKLFK